jgi:hypothetical protein
VHDKNFVDHWKFSDFCDKFFLSHFPHHSKNTDFERTESLKDGRAEFKTLDGVLEV